MQRQAWDYGLADGYWYGAGVPILGLQIVFAFAIGMGVLFLERSSLKAYLPTWSDLLIFFLLWGITAFLWAREPLRPSFFAPGPYPPDNAYHPYSDAATFDIGSQFALIGQGIYNGVFFDRALYMAFLVFLHAACWTGLYSGRCFASGNLCVYFRRSYTF